MKPPGSQGSAAPAAMPQPSSEIMQWESFAPLAALPFIAHAFTLRSAMDTKAVGVEDSVVALCGFAPGQFATAEQIHGNAVAVVAGTVQRVPGVDALVTTTRRLPLLIRCADCAPVFVVDRRAPAIALIHSGKRGTRANIVAATVAMLRAHANTQPADCLAFIGPCIGPCHYEMDLPHAIEAQLRTAGIGEIHKAGICTACRLDRYYSYRAERGQTGRMYALLALR